MASFVSASATLGPDMGSPINRLAWCRVNLVQGLPGTSCLFIFRMALRKYPIFKSRSGEERQIWECLERRGGRVDHPDQLRDGSNAVAAASPGAAWPCTDGCRNKRYPLGLSKTLSPSQSNLPHEQGVKCIALQGSSKPETRPPLKGGLWRRA